MAKQIDGVIESVRFKNGQLSCVRAYERRGTAYSDRVMIDRKTLLERLQKGQHFVVGSRKESWGNSFDFRKPVQVIKQEGRELIATHENAARDEIEEASFF